MINYNQKDIQNIITSNLNLIDIRKNISNVYGKSLLKLSGRPQWQSNPRFLTNISADFSRILMNKIYELFCNNEKISNSSFFKHLWTETTIDGVSPKININYSDNNGNNVCLFEINHPIDKNGYLKSKNLPTLFNINKNKISLNKDDLHILSYIIKILYNSNYKFKDALETVFQPINGLTFKISFPKSKNITLKKEIHSNDEHIKLETNIGLNDISNYEVIVNNKNIANTGNAKLTENGTFIWERDSDDELLNKVITLTISFVSIEHLPALDDLFIMASKNDVLMTTGNDIDEYFLTFKDKKVLKITVSAPQQSLTLNYPDKNIQLSEMIQQYNFLKEWLKDAMLNN